MDQLRQPLCSRGREEIAVLQRRQLQDVQSRGQDEAQRVGEGSPPRDKRYYEQPVQQELEIYQLKISEFFPLERTAKGMLDIFASLLGLRFDPIASEKLTGDAIWHDTVRGFSV